MPTHQILVADEDPLSLCYLADNLTADGYTIHTADSPNQALTTLATMRPDAVVVDVNGKTPALLDLLRGGENPLLAAAADTPVIALTSYGQEVHRVRLLQRGADDVVEKPYGYNELRARLDALLRRSRAHQDTAQPLTAGPLAVNSRTREVTISGQPVHLTKVEYSLITPLVAEPHRIFTREELQHILWGQISPTFHQTLRTHIARLRTKLDSRPDGSQLIYNHWGTGYSLLPARSLPIPDA